MCSAMFRKLSLAPFNSHYRAGTGTGVEEEGDRGGWSEGGRHARSLHVERLLLDWRRKKVFADLLKGRWCDMVRDCKTLDAD